MVSSWIHFKHFPELESGYLKCELTKSVLGKLKKDLESFIKKNRRRIKRWKNITADEFRIFKDNCKQTILSSVMLEDSIKNTLDDLKMMKVLTIWLNTLKKRLLFLRKMIN